jgi:hypothetical protein
MRSRRRFDWKTWLFFATCLALLSPAIRWGVRAYWEFFKMGWGL